MYPVINNPQSCSTSLTAAWNRRTLPICSNRMELRRDIVGMFVKFFCFTSAYLGASLRREHIEPPYADFDDIMYSADLQTSEKYLICRYFLLSVIVCVGRVKTVPKVVECSRVE